MHITRFEITSGGKYIGVTPVREQAVGAAKAYASKNERDVSVIAYMDNGRTREIIVKPDGSVVKVWEQKSQA